MRQFHQYTFLAIILFFLFSCRAKEKAVHDSAPKLKMISIKNLPQWVEKYDLAFPYSIAYQDHKRFVLKSSFSLKQITSIYDERMAEQGFKLIEKMFMQNSILKQFKKSKTIISIEISSLPYSTNKIIHLGISEIK